MAGVSVTRHDFLQDREGRTFADVVSDPEQPFDAVLDFFNSEDRQRRMEKSEIPRERARLVGFCESLRLNRSSMTISPPNTHFAPLGCERWSASWFVWLWNVWGGRRPARELLYALESPCPHGRQHPSAPRSSTDWAMDGSVATFHFGASP
jgi:hypothetical protein